MFKYLLNTLGLIASSSVFALGMQPETTIVVLNQDVGEASISVKNTNDSPSLLQTKIVDQDDSKGALVLAAPSIVKLESGEEQIVRFFLQASGELKHQQLKRVRFIGLPARSENSKDNSSLSVAVSQSIPLIVNPVGLKPDKEPWKNLNYNFQNGKLELNNPSPYVVRLYPQIRINGEILKLPRSSLSPKEKVEIDYKRPPTEVKIKPVGLYGEVRDEYKVERINL
ncbi:TPA: fimbria/pilus periplasmic chaperone [Escherichia coli]